MPRLRSWEMKGNRCLLELDDGQAASVEIHAETLATLLGGSPPEVRERGVEVYLPHPPMSDQDWSAIWRHLDLAQFDGNERIRKLLALSAADLAALPCRVYGGTDMGRTLYLSRPINFRRLDGATFGALLNDGDTVWRVRIDLASGDVEVEGGELPGHFVSDE